ncbi:MAG: hypothetical protein ACYSYL_17490 [Planctomycetota bacterium]|jgi:hypothetical protein
MGFTKVCHNLACGIGRFIGGSFSVLVSVRKALGGSMGRLRPLSSRKKIRTIVLEELARSQGADQKITLAELEERLRLMADTIEAIQKRILELSGRGLEHEALVSAAMASVENVSLLNEEERVILTNIFRQNVAIQKPELVDNVV